MPRTFVVFGAGTGLGQAVAHKFGAQGYRVALVARRREPLDRLASELGRAGVEAAAFTADLADPAAVDRALAEIRARFGTIDAVQYAPAGSSGFTPAADLRPELLAEVLRLHTLTPVQIVQSVLPEMTARGDGVILVGQGMSAVTTMPGLSGVGPAMAATRNYLFTLAAEIADRGIYVGTLTIGAMILGSAAQTAVQSDLGDEFDPGSFPTVDPGTLAELLWQMQLERDRVEVVHPAEG
jgi:NAD(P)-dependent dehydrogenase (short-subunit alcohol dehydrogenase family)